MRASEAITFVISLSYRQFLLWPTPDQGLGHPRHTPALDFLLLPSLPPSPPVPLTRPWSPSLSVLSGLPGWGPWCGCLYPLLALTPLCSYLVGVVTRGLPAGGWSWLSPLLAALCGCGILVPQPGIKPSHPLLEGQRTNHWTTR